MLAVRWRLDSDNNPDDLREAYCERHSPHFSAGPIPAVSFRFDV